MALCINFNNKYSKLKKLLGDASTNGTSTVGFDKLLRLSPVAI